jgi:hypothetical protein
LERIRPGYIVGLLGMLALLAQPLGTSAADVRMIAYQGAPLVVQQCQIDTSGAQPVLRTTFNVAGTRDINVARFRYQFFDAQGHVIADARPEQSGTYTLAKTYTFDQPATTPLPSYASVECAPSYARFADGTTWFAPNQGSNVVGVLPIVLGAAVAAGIAVAVSSHSSAPSSPPVPPPTAPPPPSSLTVTPSLLTFSSSTSSAQKFTVHGGTPPYTIDASTCSTFARVTGSSPGPFTVTPIAGATTGGECTVTVRSSNGDPVGVAVVVKVPQLVVSGVAFTGPTAPAQALPLSGGAAPFTIDASECHGIATVSPASGSGPFTVKPVASNGGGGSCELLVTSANHVTQRAPVTVAPTALVVSPAYFSFPNPSAPGEKLTAQGGRAPYTIDLGKCTLIKVTPASGSRPFTVAPNGKGVGSCVIVLRSADGQTASISMVIGATPLAVTPSSVTFTSPTAPAQTFTATGGVAPYKATAVSCTTVATLSGSSPTFTLTPVSSSPGGTCVIKVTSADHQEQTVIVNVSVGTTLSVSPVALTFVTPTSAAQTFMVSGGTPPYTVASPDCSGIATFTPATLSSAGSVTVTPAGTGSCGITVDDSSAVKQSRSVAIVVGAPAFSVTPTTLEFASPSASGEDVTVSGGSAPYMVDTGCVGTADVAGSASLPGTLTVTPVAPGTCVFTVRSGNGSSVAVGVTVKATPLTVTPGTLTFTNPYLTSTAPSQTITVSGGVAPYTPDYSGCAGMIVPSARHRAGASPPSMDFTITQAQNVYGSCAFTIRSADNQSVAVIVRLEASAPLALLSLFPSPVDGYISTLVLYNGGYPRDLDTTACASLIFDSLKTLETAAFTYYAINWSAPGTCTLVGTSADGQYVLIPIVVTSTRVHLPLKALPKELTFADRAAPARHFLVAGGEKPYTLDDKDCRSVARVTGTPHGLYTVTPVRTGRPRATCSIVIRSANAERVTEQVVIGRRRSLEVNPPFKAEPMGQVMLHTLSFASPIAPPQSIRISGATTYRFDAGACAGVVTVSGSDGVYTVAPVRSSIGGATCTFGVQADGVAHTISVTVAPPLAVNPKVLEFATTHGGPQRVRVSGAQPISFVVSPNCAQALNVERGGTSGFVEEFLVHAVREPNASPCTITFMGSGQVVPLTVNLRTHSRRP